MKKDLIFSPKTSSRGTRWSSRVDRKISNHYYNRRHDCIRALAAYINKILAGEFEFEGFSTREKITLLKLLRRP